MQTRRTFLGRLAGLAATVGLAPRELTARSSAPYIEHSEQNFDIAVIGAGMFGSAAARYLSAVAEGIALIGPQEPRDGESHSGVFASHYDETRLTRVVDPDLIWATLAKRSVARYRELERASGIEFYSESGYMMVTPGGGAREWFDFPAMRAVARDLNVELNELDDVALKNRFPTLRFTPGSVGLLQQRDAGIINPRRLVAAQQKVARAQGTTLIREVVVGLRPTGTGVEIQTRSGDTLNANRVLLATGAYANANNLLPRELDMQIRAAMVMLAEVPQETDFDWPSILYVKTDGAEPFWGLLMPPVTYPDGRRYVKTMDDYYGPRSLSSSAELGSWYQSHGHQNHYSVLQRALEEIAPTLQISGTRFVPCLIADSATHYPYIDMISERIGVVAGGNGKGAKSSDEIGRLGAEMIRTGDWPPSLPEALFSARIMKR
ncbi:MAG: NAD(P)/FAD-dependent oxidoreductase [Gemmatimonadales bacterium]